MRWVLGLVHAVIVVLVSHVAGASPPPEPAPTRATYGVHFSLPFMGIVLSADGHDGWIRFLRVSVSYERALLYAEAGGGLLVNSIESGFDVGLRAGVAPTLHTPRPGTRGARVSVPFLMGYEFRSSNNCHEICESDEYHLLTAAMLLDVTWRALSVRLDLGISAPFLHRHAEDIVVVDTSFDDLFYEGTVSVGFKFH